MKGVKRDESYSTVVNRFSTGPDQCRVAEGTSILGTDRRSESRHGVAFVIKVDGPARRYCPGFNEGSFGARITQAEMLRSTASIRNGQMRREKSNSNTYNFPLKAAGRSKALLVFLICFINSLPQTLDL